jgi:hypothetical protein
VEESNELIRDSQALLSKLLVETGWRERRWVKTGWRERVVEELIFSAGEHVHAVTTYQFGLARGFLESHLEDEGQDSIRLFLPVTRRDKRLLLDFDLRASDGRSGFLLPRDQISYLQTRCLLAMFADAGYDVPSDRQLVDLLEAICTFTPAWFERFLDQVKARPRHPPNDTLELAVARYLTDGLTVSKHKPNIEREQVREWRDQTAGVRELLRGASEQPHELGRSAGRGQPDMRINSAVEVLLALPKMHERPTSTDEISTLLSAYCAMVQALGAGSDRRPLRELTDWGWQWAMIAELTVPVGERFAITISEDRPIRLHKRRSHQRFRLTDATSAHLEVRVIDPNVQLGIPQLRDSLDRERESDIGFGELDDVRRTKETISLYSSIVERPRFIDVDIELLLTRDLRLASLLVGALTLASIATALLLPAGSNLVVGVAVVAVPTTVAAALLTVREQTALAGRLQTRPRALIAILLVLLWGAVLVRLLWAGAALAPWHGYSRRACQSTALTSSTTGGPNDEQAKVNCTSTSPPPCTNVRCCRKPYGRKQAQHRGEGDREWPVDGTRQLKRSVSAAQERKRNARKCQGGVTQPPPGPVTSSTSTTSSQSSTPTTTSSTSTSASLSTATSTSASSTSISTSSTSISSTSTTAGSDSTSTTAGSDSSSTTTSSSSTPSSTASPPSPVQPGRG